MALLKSIELNNGVVINYHRIASINKLTNHSTVLAIMSYTSKAKRDEEVAKSGLGEMLDIYTETEYMEVNYDETATIKDWYNYLKTTDKYNGAEDA